MNNRGVSVKYGDVALGAKEGFSPSMTDLESFSDVSVLKKNNVNFPNYGNPIEDYSVLLDGSVKPFPSETYGKTFAVWSDSLSGEDGRFSSPIVLEFSANDLFTSSGITMNFDIEKEIYPIEVTIEWSRGGDVIASESFHPNSASYFFNKKVEYYDGVKVTFFRLNLPNNRLRIYSIDYGIGVVFRGDELTTAKIIQQIDPISSELFINPFDFGINSRRNIEFSFQNKQPISVYFDGNLKGTFFVKKANKKSKKQWSIQSDDYIGLMDTIPFSGGVYLNADADLLIRDIFETAKIPYKIDDVFVGEKISGHIPYTNCREALKQICFAIGASIKTSCLDFVYVFKPSDSVSQTLPESRVMVGQDSSEDGIITAVEMTYHEYKPNAEESIVYSAEEDGVGEGLFIIFSEPLHDLSIQNGEILSYGSNHAVINASIGAVLRGKKYDHVKTTKTKRNPVVSSADLENVVSVKDATLVSRSNVDKILNLCYNEIVGKRDINLKIIDGKHNVDQGIVKFGEKKYGSFKYGEEKKPLVIYDEPTDVGDIVNAPTDIFGRVEGRIVKQSFSLAGGILVKDSVLR